MTRSTLVPLLLKGLLLSSLSWVSDATGVISDKIVPNKDILRLSVEEEHFPFLHGVGSADPSEDAVLIWTRVSPPLPWQNQIEVESSYEIEWKVWLKNEEQDAQVTETLWESTSVPVVAQGTVTVSPDHDYTLTVDVTGLEPDTHYYYQFQDHAKTNATHTRRSRIGTTRTITTQADEINVAVLSCTSLWSGYFNMYRHMAQASNLDVIVHLGDFIYPELDPDELYRIPYGLCENHFWFGPTERFHGDYNAHSDKGAPGIAGTPQDNEDPYVAHMLATFPHCDTPTISTFEGYSVDPDAMALSQYRWMHQLYMMDPDLRDARAAHPFVVQFDNHDLGDDYPTLATANSTKGSAKAGFEWVPQRVNIIRDETTGAITDVETFRQFSYGRNALLDIILLDTAAYGGTYAQKREEGLLGQGQKEWLQKVLVDSAKAGSQWRILGSGKAFMPFTLNKLGRGLNIPLAVFMVFFLLVLGLLMALQWCIFKARRRCGSGKTTNPKDLRQRTRSIEMDLLMNSRQGEADDYDHGMGDDETEELTRATTEEEDNYVEDEHDDQEPQQEDDDGSSESLPLARHGQLPPPPTTTPKRRGRRRPRTRTLSQELLQEAHHESPLLLRCCTSVWYRVTLAWPLFWLVIALWVRQIANKNEGLFLFDSAPVTWTGQHESVTQFFDQLEATQTTNNNIWVTGDAHICYASDVFRYNPFERDILGYKAHGDDNTNTTRYGVEMLPCSGTRGNLDEMVGSILGPLFHPRGILSFISKFTLHYGILVLNKHFRYFNGDDHGYGLVKVTREQITATFYLFPILKVTDKYKTKTMVLRDGENQWA